MALSASQVQATCQLASYSRRQSPSRRAVAPRPSPRCPQDAPAPHSCKGRGALLVQAGNEQGEHSPSPEPELPTPRLV